MDPDAVEPDDIEPDHIEPDDIDPDLDSPRWDIALVVSAGGAIGGLSRLGLCTLLPRSGAGFPWATCVENVVGCLLIGVLMAYVLDVWAPNRYRRPFLGTGILGGFTTYLALSLLLGLAAVVAGRWLVHTLRGVRS